MDFHTPGRSPTLNSPRGLPESNGRAVISALRALQNKMKEMELNKTNENMSQRMLTPKLPVPRSVRHGRNVKVNQKNLRSHF